MPNPSPLRSLPSTTDERHSLLLRLIDKWYADPEIDRCTKGAFPAQETYDCPIPHYLDCWWNACGKRHDVWSRQDHFLSSNEVFVIDNRLVFYVENQGVVHWGFQLEYAFDPDPPVEMTIADGSDEWQPLDKTLSAFALHAFAYNLNFHPSEAFLYGFADPNTIAYADRNYPALDFPPNWWPGGRMYGLDDIIIHIDDGDFLHATALASNLLDPFRTLAQSGAFNVHARSDEGEPRDARESPS